MLASKLHWRILIATVLLLLAAAFLMPKVVPAAQMQENRVLAPAPKLPRTWKELDVFRAETDAYVADHFPARTHLISVLNRVRMMVGVSGSNRVIIGRDGWLFFDNDSHLGAARNSPAMTPEEVRAWLFGLAGRTEALRARGTPYLVVVAPLKETVYPEKAPRWFRQPAPDRPAVSLPKLAREAGAGDVLYLHDAVMGVKARGVTVYSRHDTHWNGFGAYAGYSAMMNWLHARGITEGPKPLDQFRILPKREGLMPRDLSLMLGVASFVDLNFTHVIDDQASRGVTLTYLTDRTDWTSPYVVETGRSGKPVLLITRDSFATELQPWLYNHFSRIIFAHNQDGFFRDDLIDRFKPDLVIIEVVEGGITSIMAPAPSPGAAAMARINKTLAAHKIGKAPPLPMVLRPTSAANVALMDAAAPSGCNLEVAEVRTILGVSELSVGGWISEITPVNTAPWGMIRLKGLGGDASSVIRVDRSRPDVAAHFKQPAAEKSGFFDTFQISDLPAGEYQPIAYRRTPTGWMACPGLAKVKIGG